MSALHNSGDIAGGWVNHYRRMQRWEKRALAVGVRNFSNQTHDTIDYFLAYFVWAHSFREWLVETSAVERATLDALISNRGEWKMCRDIANRAKHFDLRRAPTDKYWIIGSRIDLNAAIAGEINQIFPYVLHDGKYLEIPDCVGRVASMWEEILDQLKLDRADT